MKAAPLLLLLLLLIGVAGACTPPGPATRDGTVIGATTVDIDTRIVTVRTGEAPIGNYITDVLRSVVTASGYDVTVALLNSGAIRGGDIGRQTVPVADDAKLGKLYPAGPLTDDDVAGWVPFRDDEVILTVTGAELKSALERGAAQLPPDLRIDGGGPLLQLSGARYTIDCAGTVQVLDAGSDAVAVEGTRVVRLEAGGALLYDRDSGVDVLATSDVRLVVNSFVASGFDGHVALVAGRDRITLPFDSFDITAELVTAVMTSSPIAPVREGRITILGDCGAPLTLP